MSGKRAKKVLVIHPHLRMLALIRRKLLRKGYQVNIARDEETCRNKLMDEKPDLIVMADKIGERTGQEIYDWLVTLGLDRTIPALFLTPKTSRIDSRF